MEFTRFPDLPLELRVKIWDIAAKSMPRILEFRWDSYDGYYAYCYPPSLLSVNFESRKYTRPLYYQSTLEHPVDTEAHYIPFCPERDILYFPYPSKCATSYGRLLQTFLRYPITEFVCAVKHLALSVPTTIRDGTMSSDLDLEIFFDQVQGIARLNSGTFELETLTFVADDSFMIPKSWSSDQHPATMGERAALGEWAARKSDAREVENKGVVARFNEANSMDIEAVERWESFARSCEEKLKLTDHPSITSQATSLPLQLVSWGDNLNILIRTPVRDFEHFEIYQKQKKATASEVLI